MPDWHVKSRQTAGWQARLGDCSREHAETVLAHLEEAEGVPMDLYLEETTPWVSTSTTRPWWALWRS